MRSEARPRLLVVDDEPADFEHIAGLLCSDEFPEYRVVWVQTRKEAIERVETEHFDCIVMDYLLPDGDGIDLVRALRTLLCDKAPPVIVLTGFSNVQVATAAFRSGAADFLPKDSLTRRGMRRAVERALSLRAGGQREGPG